MEQIFYYANGMVSVTKEGATFTPYKAGDVPQNALAREYAQADEKESEFAIFCQNISGDSKKNEDLRILIGYNLTAGSGITVITDNQPAASRTGKTLLLYGLSKMVTDVKKSCAYVKIKRHDWDKRNILRYETCFKETKLLHFDDVLGGDIGFLVDDLFDGVRVKRLYEGYILYTPKVVITTRCPLPAVLDFPVASYQITPHYSAERFPYVEFGHYLFHDWGKKEWARFDNFMLSCVQLYLERGIKK